MRKKLLGIAGQVVLVGLLLIPASVLLGAASPSARYYGVGEANLAHAPHGRAYVFWNPQAQTLYVTLNLSGLAPNSTHPAHIHTGACTDNGPVKYMLNPVIANGSGRGTSTTTLTGITGGIPAAAWSINVHNGPGLTTAAYAPRNQYIPLACANLINGDTNPYHDQWVNAPLHFTTAVDQSALGAAELWMDQDTLYVQVTALNLQPGSTHMAHIHYGSCAYQGGIAYSLQNLTANSQGIAVSTTALHGVNGIPDNGWYINVHLGVGNDLNTQTGFDPILCGNVIVPAN